MHKINSHKEKKKKNGKDREDIEEEEVEAETGKQEDIIKTENSIRSQVINQRTKKRIPKTKKNLMKINLVTPNQKQDSLKEKKSDS